MEEVTLETISKTKLRKLNKAIREFSQKLGLSDPGYKFSARQHIIRICNNRPEIKAAVRPLGGKLDEEQCAKFVRYMQNHPLGGAHLLKPILPKPPRENAKIERRKLSKSARKEKSRRQQFYESWDWKKLRYQILQKFGARCMVCGSTRDDVDIEGKRVRIVVDHIKPLYKHWELRLDPGNLQVLCHDCNKGKGAWDETDWRGN